MPSSPIDRRTLLRAAAVAGGSIAAGWLPAWAQPVSAGTTDPIPELAGADIALRIAGQTLMVDGRSARATGINGTVPAPLLRLRAGQRVRLRVTNDLDEETSLHWHGMLVPTQMDGVPGVSFPGIGPRSTFTYDFPIEQSGTYWYHSHSGLQELMGLYGPIVIAPAGEDPVRADREHVIMLSDHGRMHPLSIYRKLKQEPGYFNRQRQTLAGLLAGRDQPLAERLRWGAMRMDPTDISDVTGSVFTYVVNGHGPRDNWTALFRPGERVRLRFVNAAGMTIFNVRIPGLKLMVVHADGQAVRPVEVDEFQFAPGETYDVIVTPPAERAYTIVGEAVDRSGMARATLAPRAGMIAAVPPLRPRPVATMKDMGMDMSGMAMVGGGIDLSKPDGAMPAMAHGSMKMRDPANAPSVLLGPGVQTIAPMPVDRTGEPGQGLADAGHKALVYRDLVALEANPDVRAPAREIQVHLTGNMERYMWSMDGRTMSEAHEPIPMRAGERVRVTLVNDTMMAHPIHLHGHFFELVTGHGEHAPRKHTINVAPGGKVSWDVTAAPGDWAFHCHMFFHMLAGMMRVVQVRPFAGAPA
ncbi:copper resistance system multicopper oxidase [Sphingopyxis indica]|uniref:copper resistance system multicopper oxidase n=1 Tax=Sphingopyxis indica TaxID=436663 RepID=UPI00293936C5|nr:copper resistance system multicopper oxidase [Sphingopyxis indica]WOF44965.1 copper resistance system multicopper oxidase [Sphingopyxis indica]